MGNCAYQQALVTVLGDGKEPMRRHEEPTQLELPMSTGLPPKPACLRASPNYSVQRVKRRKPLMSDALQVSVSREHVTTYLHHQWEHIWYLWAQQHV
ncbi:unnamed protein product [Boreogadus saida]